MKKMLSGLLMSVVMLTSASNLFAQNKDVVDIAIGSSAHTTLVAAVKAADLVTTLKSAGPFTVFAPTNDAFGKLPAGTVETLLKPENKSKLTSILTYHVVAGNLLAADVVAAIKKGNGKAEVTTVNGQKLTITLMGDKVMLTDANGKSAHVVAADLKGSNGVVHVIDSVVLPK
ncbi:MAG: fasciclin domain-containing protein [Chitinophagaceae bacterium]